MFDSFANILLTVLRAVSYFIYSLTQQKSAIMTGPAKQVSRHIEPIRNIVPRDWVLETLVVLSVLQNTLSYN